MAQGNLTGNLVNGNTGLSGNLTGNTITLSGGIGNFAPGGSAKNIHSDTTENWNAQPDLIAKLNHIYVYLDYIVTDDGNVPGIKIGNGNTKLADLQFLSGNTIWGQITGDVNSQEDLIALFSSININNLSQDENSFFILDCGSSTEVINEGV